MMGNSYEQIAAQQMLVGKFQVVPVIPQKEWEFGAKLLPVQTDDYNLGDFSQGRKAQAHPIWPSVWEWERGAKRLRVQINLEKIYNVLCGRQENAKIYLLSYILYYIVFKKF